MTIHDDGFADGGEAYTDEEMLFISALDNCEWRGHNMTQFEKVKEDLYRSTCKVCNMYVDVNLHPLPNEIDIGGTAVALNCEKENSLKDLLQRTITVFLNLVNECETNYLFGEDEGELKALDYAKDIINELDNYVMEELTTK